jgi:hypothetical protein
MTDQIITYETAVLAKKKGFDELCQYSYEGETLAKTHRPWKNSEDDTEYAACTQSLLQRWLREIHKIDVISLPWRDHGDDLNDPYTYRPMIHRVKTYDEYKTYEEALEFGLQEALKLIKKCLTKEGEV